MKKIITAVLITALGLTLIAQPGTAPVPKEHNSMKMATEEGCAMKGGEMGGKEKKHGMDGLNSFDSEDQDCPMMFDQVGLSKEQQEKIHQIKIKNQKSDIDTKAELKKLMIDKQEAMRELNFEKAKEATKKISDLKAKSQIANIDEKIEIFKVMTKDQIEKIKEFHKQPGMMKHKMMK